MIKRRRRNVLATLDGGAYTQNPSSMQGFLFQVQLQMLLLKTIADKEYEFRFGCEVAEIWPFDDIYIRYKDERNNWKIRCIQAKHIDPIQNKITLTKLKEFEGDFSLKKYFDGFCESIKPILSDKLDEIHDLVIITPVNFHPKQFNINKKDTGTNIKPKKKIDWANFFEFDYLSEDDLLYIETENEVKAIRFKNDDKHIEEIRNALKELFASSTNEGVSSNQIDDGDLTIFIKKLVFIVNYPRENELDKWIEKKIGEQFNLLDANFPKNSFKNAMIEMINKYKKETVEFYTHKEAANIFDNSKRTIYTYRLSGFSADYIKLLETYNIVFSSNFQSDIKQLMSNSNDTILYLNTKCTMLTMIKVRQTVKTLETELMYDFLTKVDGCFFIHSEKLLQDYKQDKTAVVLFLSSNEKNHLLVIECQSENSFKEVFELCHNLSKSIKIILVAQNVAQTVENIEDKQISFEHLTDDSKKELMTKMVTFQGKKLSWNRFMNDAIANEIDSNVLSDILTEENIEIGKIDSFFYYGYVEEYFIERKIACQSMDVLSTRLLHLGDIQNTIFLITSEQQIHEVPLIILKNSLDTIQYNWTENVSRYSVNEWNDGQIYENGIVIADLSENEREIYKEMCELHSNKHIYWFQFVDTICMEFDTEIFDIADENLKCLSNRPVIIPKHLNWKGFTDNSLIMKKHIDSYSNEKQSLEDIIRMNQKVNIVSNDPGYGKSTVLTKLANILRDQTCDSRVSWVIRIELTQYAKIDNSNSLDKYKFETKDDAMKFISNIALNGHKIFEKKLFEHFENVIVLIDAFDEICPTYRTKVIQLIKHLKECSNIGQIWISTRRCEEDYLENELKVPAFILCNLNKKEQLEFLEKYWNYQIKNKKMNSNATIIEHLRGMSDNERKTELNKNANRLRDAALKNKRHTDLCVPLFLEMLADLALENDFNINELNFNDVYGQIIDLKLNIYAQNKCQSAEGIPAANFAYKIFLDDVRDIHQELALQEIFRHQDSSKMITYNRWKKRNNKSDDEIKRDLNTVGLLKPNSLEFIHRAIAEFLLIQYIIENLDSDQILIVFERIVCECYTFKYIRKLLNMKLKTDIQKKSFHNIIEKVICQRKSCEMKQNPSYWSDIYTHQFSSDPEHFKLMDCGPDECERLNFGGYYICCYCNKKKCHCILYMNLIDILKVSKDLSAFVSIDLAIYPGDNATYGSDTRYFESSFINKFLCKLLTQHRLCKMKSSLECSQSNEAGNYDLYETKELVMIDLYKVNMPLRQLECNSLGIIRNLYFQFIFCHCNDSTCDCKFGNHSTENADFATILLQDQNEDRVMFQEILSKLFKEANNETVSFSHYEKSIDNHKFQSEIYKLKPTNNKDLNNYYYIRCFCKSNQCPQIEFIFLEFNDDNETNSK